MIYLIFGKNSMTKFFFGFLNTLLPEGESLSDSTLDWLQNVDHFAQRYVVEDYLRLSCTHLTEQPIATIAQDLQLLFADAKVMLTALIEEGSPRDESDPVEAAETQLNFFVLSASLHAAWNNPLLSFLNTLNREQIREFRDSSFANQLEEVIAKLSKNADQFVACLGVDALAEDTLLDAGMSALLLCALQDLDRCIQLLNERLRSVRDLAALFNLKRVGQMSRRLGFEKKDEAIVRRIERALLANTSGMQTQVRQPAVHEFFQEINFSMADALDQANLLHKANQLVGTKFQDNILVEMVHSAERACELLSQQLHHLKRALETTNHPRLVSWIARWQELRTQLKSSSPLPLRSAAPLVVLTDTITQQRDVLLTQFIIKSVTVRPELAQAAAVVFVPPTVSRQSIEVALDANQQINPIYRSGIAHALSYFYIQIPERLMMPGSAPICRAFFERWSELQHHAFVDVLGQVSLEAIRGFEHIEGEAEQTQADENQRFSVLLTTLKDNQKALRSLNTPSWGATTLKDMFCLWVANVRHVMMDLEGLLIRRKAVLSGLDRFFDKIARTKNGKDVLRRLAKATTLLLPKERQAIDGKIREISLRHAGVKAEALRRIIDKARLELKSNPFKDVIVSTITQTENTIVALNYFITHLTQLPWQEDISSLLDYRRRFAQTYRLRDATIVETLHNASFFVRDQHDEERFKTEVVTFNQQILPTYMNAFLIHAWFSALPSELSNLMTQRADFLALFDRNIKPVFYPVKPCVWDHVNLESLLISDQLNAPMCTDQPVVIRHSYTLAIYMAHYAERTRLRPGIMQADIDQMLSAWFVLPIDDATTPLLSLAQLKTSLSLHFFPFTNIQTAFAFFEMNTYRLQAWLNEGLSNRLERFGNQQARIQLPASLSPAEYAVMHTTLEYMTHTHQNIVRFVRVLQARFMRLIEDGYEGPWLHTLRTEVMDRATNHNNRIQLDLTLLQRQLSNTVLSQGEESMRDTLVTVDYLAQLNTLEQAILSSSRPDSVVSVIEPEFKAAADGLAEVITWHHRLQFAALPMEVFFVEQTSCAELDEARQRLSALVESSLLARGESMTVRTLRFRRWLCVLDSFLTMGNFYGYEIVSAALERMSLLLPTAYSYVNAGGKPRYENTHKLMAVFAEHDSMLAPIPPLSWLENKKEYIPSTPLLFKGFLDDQDVRHHQSFFPWYEALYRAYVENVRRIEACLPHANVLFATQRPLEANWFIIRGERLLSRRLNSTAIVNRSDIEHLANTTDADDARLFPIHAAMPATRTLTPFPAHAMGSVFSFDRRNIIQAITGDLIDTMLATSASFTEIELFKTELFRQDPSFLVRLARLFSSHPAFATIHRFCISNNQRNYDQAIPLDHEQYTYTMQFIDAYFPVICRCYVFESQLNGLTGEFLSQLARARPQQLVELGLYGNQLGVTADGSSLLRELMAAVPLRVLNINQNNFGKHKNLPNNSVIEARGIREDAKNLAEGIRACKTLEDLDIGGNDWGNSGMNSILEAVETLPNLRVLRLFNCGMSKLETAEKLLDVIKNKPSIQTVIYDGNEAFMQGECAEKMNALLLARQQAFSVSAASIRASSSFFNEAGGSESKGPDSGLRNEYR